ncbi:hypothetical protein MC885_016040, partial [Smutsia gigantea]
MKDVGRKGGRKGRRDGRIPAHNFALLFILIGQVLNSFSYICFKNIKKQGLNKFEEITELLYQNVKKPMKLLPRKKLPRYIILWVPRSHEMNIYILGIQGTRRSWARFLLVGNRLSWADIQLLEVLLMAKEENKNNKQKSKVNYRLSGGLEDNLPYRASPSVPTENCFWPWTHEPSLKKETCPTLSCLDPSASPRKTSVL